MSRPEIVLTADTHFRSRGAYVSRDLKADALHSFDQIVAYCLRRRPGWLIVLGDLMEATDVDAQTPELHRALHDRFARLHKAGVQVGYILGNHDVRVDWWQLEPTVQHLSGPLTLLGKPAYALDWAPTGSLNRAIQEIPPGTEILLAHQVWEELRSGNYTEPEGRLADLIERGISWVWTGDYHKHLALEVRDDLGQTLRALSPGPICQQTISEDPFKKFFSVRRDSSGNLAWKSLPLLTRPVFRVRLEADQDLEEFLTRGISDLERQARTQNLPEDLVRPLVEVFYYTDLTGVRERLQTACGSRFHYFSKPWDRSRPSREFNTATRQRLAETGLVGVVTTLTRDQPAVRAAALRLLDPAVDPARELEAILREPDHLDGPTG